MMGLESGGEARICVFVKAPIEGDVKTRLAATIGTARATELARAFIEDTFDAVASQSRMKPVAVVAGDASLIPPLPANMSVWAQGGGDLGARLERCMSRALAGGADVLIVGTDSPGLPVELIDVARRALESHDVVIGPADDGGFYLVGATKCPRGMFSDLPWSDPRTCQATLARFRRLGLSVFELPPWFDVDVEADLERLRRLLDAGVILAPATARILGVERPGQASSDAERDQNPCGPSSNAASELGPTSREVGP